MPQGRAEAERACRNNVAPVGVMPGDGSGLLQVIAEARRLGFYSVRGNHDDKALAAYEAFKANKPVPAKTRWAHALPTPSSNRLKAFHSRECIIIGHPGRLPSLKVCHTGFANIGLHSAWRSAIKCQTCVHLIPLCNANKCCSKTEAPFLWLSS